MALPPGRKPLDNSWFVKHAQTFHSEDKYMKFMNHQSNGTKIEMEIPDDSSIDEVLEAFQSFLRASGYMIDYNKVLDLINMDEN
jgi:hypothetical protein